ncbi:sulfatase family protein [Pareuzebyella sediminis]|uniref:sulfatase family protein n=1 Tax=Pareuzebyella sediminis TaxID=2607998 RepID=UPI0018E0E9B7|nr:sulfatase [Pareuzebyella sediminis]
MKTIRPTAALNLFLLIFLLAMSPPSNSEKKPEKDSTKLRTAPNILFMIADDWSYPHAGVYGDPVVRTPTFDRLANEGAVFENAYCAAPSCSPSRASILLGRYPHQNEAAGNLWSIIPDKFPNWVSLLKQSGYHTGKSRKGWGPGDYKSGGYEHNPAGKEYLDFETFLDDKSDDQPFAYWFGSQDPHRTYETNTGVKTGMDAESVVVPEFLPDTPCVRNDIMDYFFEAERFDRESGNIIDVLERKGLLDNTLIVMTSDNGMPFPRAKANLYDYGTRMPLAMYWKGHIEGGQRITEFMNFIDFGPTFLEAAGVEIPKAFSGHSLMALFSEEPGVKIDRTKVFLERERHANVRKGDLSYPVRAIRTKDYLYIKNFEPDRWPAGDPHVHQSVGQYGDIDNSISKFLIMEQEGKPTDKDYFELAFAKRPKEEFYVLASDPYNLRNEIENKNYGKEIASLRKELQEWMSATDDLRAKAPHTVYWDTVLYTPDYQFNDYDLNQKIKEYDMLVRKGGLFEGANCLE